MDGDGAVGGDSAVNRNILSGCYGHVTGFVLLTA